MEDWNSTTLPAVLASLKAQAQRMRDLENNRRLAQYLGELNNWKMNRAARGDAYTVPKPYPPMKIAFTIQEDGPTPGVVDWQISTEPVCAPEPEPPVVAVPIGVVVNVGPRYNGSQTLYHSGPGDNAPDGWVALVGPLKFTKRLVPGPFGGGWAWYECEWLVQIPMEVAAEGGK